MLDTQQKAIKKLSLEHLVRWNPDVGLLWLAALDHDSDFAVLNGSSGDTHLSIFRQKLDV